MFAPNNFRYFFIIDNAVDFVKVQKRDLIYIINFAVFALPIIIYLLGAKIMVNAGFNSLLSVNVMFNSFSAVQIGIPVIVTAGIICLIKKS